MQRLARAQGRCPSPSFLPRRIGTSFSAIALDLRSKILQKEELRVGLRESLGQRLALSGVGGLECTWGR